MGTKLTTQSSTISNKFQESLEHSNVAFFAVDEVPDRYGNWEGWFYYDEANDSHGPFDTEEIAQANEYMYAKWLEASSVDGLGYDDWKETQKNPSIHDVDN